MAIEFWINKLKDLIKRRLSDVCIFIFENDFYKLNVKQINMKTEELLRVNFPKNYLDGGNRSGGAHFYRLRVTDKGLEAFSVPVGSGFDADFDFDFGSGSALEKEFAFSSN